MNIVSLSKLDAISKIIPATFDFNKHITIK